jgi:hypothetical protein
MFQRVTTPENAHTNNTLVLFQEIHERNPEIFMKLIKKLFHRVPPEKFEGRSHGLKMVSHYSQSNLVQPGILTQSGLQLGVITDFGSSVDVVGQKILRCREAQGSVRYFSGFSYTLLLTVRERYIPHDALTLHVSQCTFANLCRELRWACRDSNLELLADDYTHYCLEQGLIDNARRYMRICPYPEESEFMNDYGVYADPVESGFVPHGYMGLYAKAKFTCLWEVQSIVRVDISCKTFELENFEQAAKRMTIWLDSGTIHNEEDLRKKLAAFIFEKWQVEREDLREGYRFYCGYPHKITNWPDLQLYTSKTLLSSGNDRYFFDLREYIWADIDGVSPSDIASGAVEMHRTK